MSDTATMTPGRLYRVGKHWYVDTALLQGIARRITVEPMQGGYQILAPSGLVRCVPAVGQTLPGQTGDLYRCKGAGQDLRKLATAHGIDAALEFETWPSGAIESTTKPSCGCTSCKAGSACPCGTSEHDHDDHETASLLERLIISETLGTIAPRTVSGDAIALFPAQHGAPEWACGRYHECIASILRFPDIGPREWIALVEFRKSVPALKWGVVLDRQRTLMLTEILHRVARLADRTARSGSAVPSPPTRQTPGSSAWEAAAQYVTHTEPCTRCPYRLGTNLRCPTCRRWRLDGKPNPGPSQGAAILKYLREQPELRTLAAGVLRTVAQTIAHSHAQNPHEPLSDRFFLQLERDVLLAQQTLQLDESQLTLILELAELSPLEPEIVVGFAARQEAA